MDINYPARCIGIIATVSQYSQAMIYGHPTLSRAKQRFPFQAFPTISG